MKKSIRTLVAALTLVGFTMADIRSARADTTGDTYLGEGFSESSSTTVLLLLLTTGGVVVLIYFLVIRKKDSGNPSTSTDGAPPPPPPAAPGAFLYLRDLGPELAQNLAEGRGQTFVDFADALEIPAAHRPAFAHAMKTHRTRLLDLADPARLTEARSVEFLSEVVAAMREDQGLTSDLDLWASHMTARLHG